MFALIPHKDTLFLLAQLQKKIISSYNMKYTSVNNNDESSVFPNYPLWCFFSKTFQPDFFKDLSSCKIEAPVHNNKELYFPLVFCFKDDTKKLEGKIIFATFNAKKNPVHTSKISLCKQDIQLYSEKFPINTRIFRFAEVVTENNGYKVFNDRWIKIKL